MATNRDTLLDPNEETRFKKRNAPLARRLARSTHFNLDEVEALLLIHYKLGRLDHDRLLELFHAGLDMTDPLMAARIFAAIDRENCQEVTPESWVVGLSVLLRGTALERMKYCFKVFDMMGEGMLIKNTMNIDLLKTLVKPPIGEDMDSTIKDLTETVMKKLDKHRSGKVTLEDFCEAVQGDPLMIECLGSCMPSRRAVNAFLTTFCKKPGRV